MNLGGKGPVDIVDEMLRSPKDCCWLPKQSASLLVILVVSAN